MTRVLSELLGAREPDFHHGLRRLEATSGHTNADIRLTSEVERAVKLKLRELGLDPTDTIGPELYEALAQRVKADDARLSHWLHEQFAAAKEPHAMIAAALDDLPLPKQCFALKLSVGKRFLQKLPPKKTMKVLGYRSLDSMLRREQLLAVLAAAWLLESATWRKGLVDNYKKLTSADFELRPLAILAPQADHWHAVSELVSQDKKHLVVGLREFAAVVILPFPERTPPTMTIATMLMGLHEMNEVRAGSTYLKLAQVRPDFGSLVQTVVAGEPLLFTALLDGPVQWQVIQRYYARYGDRFREDLFEPHIQREDLAWHSVEKALAYMDPTLSFWQHTASLGILAEDRPVSFNVIDAALNFCNQLAYEHRMVHYFRRSLWSELMIRYLQHEAVEEAVLSSLEAQLVDQA